MDQQSEIENDGEDRKRSDWKEKLRPGERFKRYQEDVFNTLS